MSDKMILRDANKSNLPYLETNTFECAPGYKFNDTGLSGITISCDLKERNSAEVKLQYDPDLESVRCERTF